MSFCASRFRRCLVAAAVTLVASGCAGGPQVSSLPPAKTPLPLESGDRIQVSVFGQESMGAETTLGNDGDVTLPLVGRVHLADMTPDDAETAIGSRLRASGLVVDPKVTVDIVKYRPIYVLGEVGKPGSYDYANNMTLIQAIALAGGYTYRAKMGEATVLRHGVKGDTPVQVSDTTPLEPGDVVNVPERWY